MNIRKKVRKIICIFILITVFTFYTTACSKTQLKPPENTEPIVDKVDIQLRITWDSFSGRGEAIRAIINRYNAKPESKANVTLIGGNENLEDTQSLLTQPDNNTIFVLPYRYIKHYGYQGMLKDLGPSMNQNKDLFYEDIWNLNVVDDALYGVPWIGHSICILYNKSLLKQAGVNPDDIVDMASFVKALETVEAKTSAKGLGLVGAKHNDVSWMVNQFVYGFGSSLVDVETGTVSVNNDQSLAAIEFYKNVLGNLAQDNWENETGVDVMAHFLNQEIAFEFQGVWGITDIHKNGRPFEVGIILPKVVGLRAEAGPLMLSVPESFMEANKSAAEDFIQYLISSEAQTQIMMGEYSPEHDTYYPFRLPMRIDLFETLIAENYEDYLPFIEGMKDPSIDVPIPEWEIIKTKYYEEGLHQVMIGELDIATFLQSLEVEAQKIIDESRQKNGN